MLDYPFWRLTNPDRTIERGLTWQQMRLVIDALRCVTNAEWDVDEVKKANNLVHSFVRLMAEHPTPPNDDDYGECADF